MTLTASAFGTETSRRPRAERRNVPTVGRVCPASASTVELWRTLAWWFLPLALLFFAALFGSPARAATSETVLEQAQAIDIVDAFRLGEFAAWIALDQSGELAMQRARVIDRGETVLAGIYEGVWFDTGTLDSFLETSSFLSGGGQKIEGMWYLKQMRIEAPAGATKDKIKSFITAITRL